MATNALETLELRENNPYSIGSLFLFPEGDVLLDPGTPVFNKSTQDRYYTVEESDTMWTIAHKAYGNSKWYWVIQYANDLDFAFDIATGDVLLIPDLTTFKAASI